MNEHIKISDLTVAEFRALMAQCLKAEADRVYEATWGSYQRANASQQNITKAQGLAWMQERLNPASRMGRP